MFIANIPMRIIFFYILFIFFSLGALAQDVKVICPNEVALNQQFQLRYEVENANLEDIKYPSLNNFTILSHPKYSSNSGTYHINGKTIQESKASYTLVLQPKTVGDFTIGPATLLVNGKKIKTSPKKVHVVENNESQSIDAISNKDVYIQAVLSKKKVFEQEAVKLTYRLYCKHGVNCSPNASKFTPPDFKGVTSIQTTTLTPQLMVERINGDLYKYIDYVEYVLFPQQSGIIEIPIVTIDCVVSEQDPDFDFHTALFNNITRQRILTCTSQPINLNVSPLPQPQPADFIGLVGDITMEGEWKTSNIQAEEPAHYQLTISGKGNLNLMLPPKMADTDSIEIYDTTTQEEIEINNDGYTGKVIYDYTILPKFAGKSKLPPLTASYYNLAKGRYEQLTTGEIAINVLPAPKKITNENTTDINDIHPINEGSHQIQSIQNYLTWGNIFYWLKYLLLTIGGIIIYIIIRRFSKHDISSKIKREALSKALRNLKIAEEYIKTNDSDKFHVKILQTIDIYLVEKFHIERALSSRQEIEDVLTSYQVDTDCIMNLKNIIDVCEFAKFAPPSDTGSLTELLNNTNNVLQNIDKISK